MYKHIKVFPEPFFRPNGAGNDKLFKMICKYQELHHYKHFHIGKDNKHSTHVIFTF